MMEIMQVAGSWWLIDYRNKRAWEFDTLYKACQVRLLLSAV